MSRDRSFLIAMGLLFGFMLCFGIGVTVLAIVNDATDTVAIRVVGALGSMFASVTGLVFGYLVGRRNGNGASGPGARLEPTSTKD